MYGFLILICWLAKSLSMRLHKSRSTPTLLPNWAVHAADSDVDPLYVPQKIPAATGSWVTNLPIV